MDKKEIQILKQGKLKQRLIKQRGLIRVPVEGTNPCIYRDEKNCIKCGRCKEVCENEIGMLKTYNALDKLQRPVCIGCGQCTAVCGTYALNEKSCVSQVFEAIQDVNKILVVSVAPSVRVALAEEFGFEAGKYDEGRMISALRAVGFDYVFDITFSADLTVMEEASELVSRIYRKTGPLPQFTSCCPAWVKFMEIFYPKHLNHLSTSKSPISMQGSLVKTYFAKKKNFKPENIVHVVIAPCTAKKAEILRPENNVSKDIYFQPNLKDVDYILTTRELARMIMQLNIPYGNLDDGNFDKLFSRGSGAGIIFGNTGGVMQAALRTAYYLITGSEPPENLLQLEKVRGLEGVKEDEVNIGGATLKVAVVSGIKNAKPLMDKLESGTLDYDFVEVMTCSGGCVSGGGQPKTEIPITDDLRKKRINGLYGYDNEMKIRSAHNNPEIKALYDEYLLRPLSEESKKLLHTQYIDRHSEYFKK